MERFLLFIHVFKGVLLEQLTVGFSLIPPISIAPLFFCILFEGFIVGSVARAHVDDTVGLYAAEGGKAFRKGIGFRAAKV